MKKRMLFVAIFLILLLGGILFLMLRNIQRIEPLAGTVELYLEGVQEGLAERAVIVINDSDLVQENFLNPFERSDIASDGLVMRALRIPDHETPFFKIKLTEMLKSKLPEMDLDSLKIMDYRECASILSQFPRGLIWLSEILLFALLVIVIVRKSIHFHNWFKEEHKHYYFEEVVRNKKNAILRKIGGLLFLFLPSVYLLNRIIDFQFDIPGELLPPLDIFDLAFYLGQAGSRVQQPSPDGAEFNQLLSRCEILSVLYMVLLILLFIFLMTQLRKIGRRG